MQLLKHFKELTVRPKNAHELKGLILQLAIQGKLTRQWRKENTDVEIASDLIKRVEKEKAQLINKKKLRKEKPLPPITKDEMSFELPINWKWFNLGDLGNAQTGTTPPTKNPENYGTFIPFLGPADISNSFMQYPIDGLSEEGLRKGRLIESNSLMMVCIGGSMGKCNINRQDVSCNQQINILNPLCSPVEYVKIVCQSPYFQTEVWERSTGSATPMINKNKWLQIPISVPPLEEQKAIVEVVETLFKEVEQLEQLTVKRITLKEKFVASALNQLTTNNAKKEWAFLQDHFKTFFNETTNIKKLRETVLQLAVQGKLTADWRANNPDTEDASVLLKRIQVEKAKLIKDKKIKKESPLPIITKDEIPYKLPKGWIWTKLGEVCSLINGDRGKNYPSKAHYISEGIPFITARNLGERFLKHDSLNYISEERYDLLRSGQVQLNDILYCLRGSLGKCSIVEGIDRGAIASSLVIIRGTELLDSYFMLNYFSSPLGQEMIYKYDNGTAQPNLSATDLKKYFLPLPPLEEQNAIVQKVNALMGLCDFLEQEVQQSQEQSEKLMQSVLREVFEGKKEVETDVLL